MPRVIPRRRRDEPDDPDDGQPIDPKYWPEPTPPPRTDLAFEVVADRPFVCEGVRFEPGDIVSADSELVRRIMNEYPYPALFRPKKWS